MMAAAVEIGRASFAGQLKLCVVKQGSGMHDIRVGALQSAKPVGQFEHALHVIITMHGVIGGIPPARLLERG